MTKHDLITNLLYITTHVNQNQTDDELLQKTYPVHPFVHCFLCYIKRQNQTYKCDVINRMLTGYIILRQNAFLIIQNIAEGRKQILNRKNNTKLPYIRIFLLDE